MKGARWWAGAAAAGAGLVWWDRRAARAAAPLENAVGGTEREYHWRGMRVAATVRGAGPPVLLVHSIHAAASSREWRSNVDALADRYQVFTLDLLGFGRSDRPDLDYTASVYVDLVTDFAREVIGAPCALIASSLSAAHAIVAGAESPDRFPVLVLVQPTGMTRLLRPRPSPGPLQRAIRSRSGRLLFHALTTRPSIRFFLEKSYLDPGRVTDADVEYHRRTARQPGGRFAPAAFLGFRLNADVRGLVPDLRPRTLLVWGSDPYTSPLEQRTAFLHLRPDWETLLVENAGDLPHDEQPERFNAGVMEFLRRHWPSVAGGPGFDSIAATGRPNADRG
jgi:pimeloyl-ACP methyl ester carboxylesterase